MRVSRRKKVLSCVKSRCLAAHGGHPAPTLQEIAAHYRTLFAQAADAIVVFDPKTLAILDFNDEACRRLGYSRREFARLKISDFDVMETAAETKRHARRVTPRNVEIFETQHRTKRGDILDIEIRGKAILLGSRKLIQGVWRDITARKQAEVALRHMAADLEILVGKRTAALHQSMERLQAILAAAHAIAWDLDLSSGFIQEDGPAAEFFGRAEGYKQRTNEAFFRSVHPEDRSALRAHVQRALQGDQDNYTVEFRLLLPDRRIRWVAMFGRIVRDATGRPVRLRGVSLDVTAHKETEAVLAQTRRALERQALDITAREQRRIGQDLHDGVGQSLTGISYLLSAVQQTLAGKSAPEAGELERILQLFGKTAQQLQEIAHGLLPEELRIGDIADALQELASRTQERSGCCCRFTGRKNIKLADVYIAGQMYRIAQEAVNNAVKHSQTPMIEVGLCRKDGCILLTVRDSGIGISRTDGAYDGMGMRIMNYRAEMIGALLQVKSAPGKGTTVSCMLPPTRDNC